MVSPAVSPITPASAFAPGPVCVNLAVIGLFRIHISSDRTPPCYAVADQPGRNAPRAPCVSGHAFLAKPDFNFLSRVHFFLFSLFFWTAQIAPVSCPFSLSSCRISVFSVLTFHMYETKKNKKALQQFLKSLIFPPYQLHVIFPYALYMADFLFYRSQVERETFCSSFSSLNSYVSRFLRHSKKHKKTPKIPKAIVFGNFRA